MHRRSTPASPRPLGWQPLVSPRQWAILAHALRNRPEILDDYPSSAVGGHMRAVFGA